MKVITAFVCDFCPRKKARMSKGAAARHEQNCYYNPARKACASCGHFSYEKGEPPEWGTNYPGSPGGPCCDVEAFHVIQPDDSPSAMYRSECEQWIPKVLREADALAEREQANG